MNLTNLERYLRVNLFGPGHRLVKKEFIGPRSGKSSETLLYKNWLLVFSACSCQLADWQSTEMCVNFTVMCFDHNTSSSSSCWNTFVFTTRKRYIYIYIYTGCLRRNVPDFGRVFLMLKYTDITQNTYVQSWTVAKGLAIAISIASLHEKQRTQIQDMLPQQYYNEKVHILTRDFS